MSVKCFLAENCVCLLCFAEKYLIILDMHNKRYKAIISTDTGVSQA
jgi:hypothetical protein